MKKILIALITSFILMGAISIYAEETTDTAPEKEEVITETVTVENQIENTESEIEGEETQKPENSLESTIGDESTLSTKEETNTEEETITAIEESEEEQNTAITQENNIEKNSENNSTFSMNLRSAASTIKYNIEIITEAKEADGSDKLVYWSGEQIMPRATFDISGDGVNIANAVTKITVPKIKANGKVVINKPTFVILDSAKSSIETEDDDNWYMTYTFESLKGGSIALAPFPFNFINEYTPGGTTITPKYELFDGDGNLLDSASITYTAKVQDYNTRKYIQQQGWMTTRATAEDNSLVKVVRRQEYKNTSAATHTPADTGWSVTYAVQIYSETTNSNTGVFTLTDSKIRLVDHLPVGAELSDISKNEGWVYDSSTHTAIWEGPAKEFTMESERHVHLSGWGKRIVLDFKNYPIHLNQTSAYKVPSSYVFTNKADFYIFPDEPNQRQLEQRESKAIFEAFESIYIPGSYFAFDMWGATNSAFGPNEYNNVYVESENDITVNAGGNKTVYYNSQILKYYSGTSMDPNDFSGGSSYELSSVRFANLDERLHFDFIKPSFSTENRSTGGKTINTMSNTLESKFNSTNNILYGIKKDGTKEVIATNIKMNQKTDIKDVSRNFEKIELSFENPLILYNDDLRFNVEAYPNAEELQNFANRVYDSAQKYNMWMEISGKESSATDITDLGSIRETHQWNNYSQIDYPRPQISFWDANYNYIVPYSNNNVREMRIGAELVGTWTGLNTEVKNIKLITLLPSGIEFSSHKNATYTTNDTSTIKPEVIENFRGTGKTAVVYTYDSKAIEHATRHGIMYYDIDVTKYTAAGVNTLEHYVVWENNEFIKAANNQYVDALDLDGDGNTSEVFMKRTTTVTFLPPEEVLSKKLVSTSVNGGWSLTAPPQDLGKDIYYNLTILNNTLIDLKSVYLIDVLPYVGDHAIIGNNDGVYLPRDSQFSTPLVEAIEDVVDANGNKVNELLLQRFNVFYSVVPQGNDLASVRDTNWLTKDQISDFTQVKSIKIELKAGSVIKAKEEISIITHNSIPFDINMDNYLKANNTIAISRNGVDYYEANRAVSTNVQYYVKGNVFFDKDVDVNKVRDGIKSSNEPSLSGYTVQLVDENGQVVISRYTNKEVSTTTDTNGNYSLPVYDRGNYKIRILKKNDKELFTVNTSQNKSDENNRVISNDILTSDIKYGETGVFTLSPTSLYAIKDAGIVLANGTIEIKKVDEDNNNLENISFELYKGTTLISTAITNSNGIAQFKDVEFGEYVIKEVANEFNKQFVLMNEKTITLDENVNDLKLQINVVNNKIKSNISIKKVDFDDNTKVLENVVFGLFDKSGKKLEEKTTNKDGIALFEDVVYGEYVIKEISTLENYNLSLEEINVNINKNGELKTYTVTNKLKKGNIEIKKVDFDDNTKVLENVVFGLFDKSGKKLEEKTTNKDGIALFEDVVYGEYVIKEISTLENYNLSLEEINVNINKNGELKTYTVTNKLKKGDVLITKVDSKDNNIKLEGVEFVLEQDGVVKYKGLTGKNGVLEFKDVIYGKYTLKETNTIKGYVLNTDKIEVNIDSNGKVINHTIKNEKITADIVFRKVDGMNNNINIKGASFVLFDANGKFLQESVSDADGMVYFLNVEYGNYTIKELKPAEGYNISHETIKVEVKEHRKTLDFGKFVNYKLYNVPYTGTKGTILSNFIVVILSSLGVFFVKRKK